MKTSAFRFTRERQNEYRRQAASRRARQSGFTLAEVIVSVAVTAMVFVSLYAGISSCFRVVQSNRENVRATQILQEKLEVARLYNWNQVTGGFIPQNFTEPYSVNAGPSGLVYSGKVTLSPAPVTETYGPDLRQIRVELTWTSGNVTHKREMTTFIAKYGLQNYFFNL
jgi:prepilin-type N-terminal cleavage/methylation domain-containing protein